MSGLGASIGNSIGDSAADCTGKARWPAPPWKIGTSGAAMMGGSYT